MKRPVTAAAVSVLKKKAVEERLNEGMYQKNNIDGVIYKLLCFVQQLLWSIGRHHADSSVFYSHTYLLLLVYCLEFVLHEWGETLLLKLWELSVFMYLPLCKVKHLGDI